MVARLRLTPGHMARHWARPMKMATLGTHVLDLFPLMQISVSVFKIKRDEQNGHTRPQTRPQ